MLSKALSRDKGNPPYPSLTGGYKKAMRPRRAEKVLIFLAPLTRGVGGVAFVGTGRDLRGVCFFLPPLLRGGVGFQGEVVRCRPKRPDLLFRRIMGIIPISDA